MNSRPRCLFLPAAAIAGAVLLSNGAEAAMVNCSAPGASIQKVVDSADGPTTIFLDGICTGDVVITKDDITISGNKAGIACDKAFPGGTGTINGTVTVDGVRARIEFLTITGSGNGVDVINRADAHLVCNDISLNAAIGVQVIRSSTAVLTGNTVRGNGTRSANPNIFFDSGLFVADASSVLSNGNTYADNQYAAIDVARQSTFRNGEFLPHEPGHQIDPDNRDVIIERGCIPDTGAGCFTNDFSPVAVDVFNGGLVDLRNAELSGEVDSEWQSSFRVGGDAKVQGIVHNFASSIVRIRDRSHFGGRLVTFKGTLQCDATSQTFSSSVQCGQTCNGGIPGTCGP